MFHYVFVLICQLSSCDLYGEASGHAASLAACETKTSQAAQWAYQQPGFDEELRKGMEIFHACVSLPTEFDPERDRETVIDRVKGPRGPTLGRPAWAPFPRPGETRSRISAPYTWTRMRGARA